MVSVVHLACLSQLSADGWGLRKRVILLMEIFDRARSGKSQLSCWSGR